MPTTEEIKEYVLRSMVLGENRCERISRSCSVCGGEHVGIIGPNGLTNFVCLSCWRLTYNDWDEEHILSESSWGLKGEFK